MMIRSVGYALSWEYWRRGIYWFVPACAVLVIALMAPIYAALCPEADVRAELNHAVFGVVCWAPLVMALASRSFLRRQYTLPMRSGTLVGWTLVNGSLAVAITYWLVAVGFNALFRADWPFWGPAWWAVVVYAAFQAAVWSVAGGRGGLLIPIVFLTLLAVFAGPSSLYQRLVPTASDNGAAPEWPTISAAELAISLAAVAAFYLAAVYVVGRDRRGDAWSLVWLSPSWWAQRVGDRVSAGTTAANEFTPRSFRSPRAAQFWMEWRSKGRYVPLAVAGALSVLWVVAVLNRLEWYSVSQALDLRTATFFITSPFVGVYLGHRSERFDMKPFLATRPLTDNEQAMVVLRHAAAACGAGAIVWLIGVAVTTAVWVWALHSHGLLPTWCNAESPLLEKALTLGGFLLVLWTLVALGAALGMARSWFVPVGGIGGVVLLMILANIAEQAPPFPAAVATLLLVAGLAGGTAAAFVAARRRRLVSMPMMLGALAVYVVLVVGCFLIARGEGAMPLEALLRIIGFCAVPLAPLAAAPLALAWNRHR
jgi:hypothetical protein